MSAPRAVIFDCDGVLFESHQANLSYYNRIFARFGCPQITDPECAAARICHTASSPAVLAQLMDATQVEEALAFAATIDYREFIPLMTEAAGLKSALTRLAAEFPLAVATNRGNSMQEILRHFGLDHHFSAVVTSRDVPAPKPAPDMLVLAAQHLEVPIEHCLFVGDSDLDRRAAAAVSMPFVGYGRSVESERRVDSHGDLVELILGQGVSAVS